MPKTPLLSCLLATVGALCLAMGCADEQKGPKGPTSHPGDAARVDPFNYKPNFGDPSISGGSLGHYDDKAMKKDLKSVFDP